MTNRRPQIYATFGAAFLLAACVPEEITVDVNLARLQGQETVAGVGTAVPTPPQDSCQKFLRVSDSGDEHLKLNQNFRVSGPSVDGDYRLRTRSNPPGLEHQVVETKNHDLVKSDGSGFKYDGWLEVKGGVGPHADPELHRYTVTMEFDANGCPLRLLFTIVPHRGSSGNQDHGGDAEMD